MSVLRMTYFFGFAKLYIYIYTYECRYIVNKAKSLPIGYVIVRLPEDNECEQPILDNNTEVSNPLLGKS